MYYSQGYTFRPYMHRFIRAIERLYTNPDLTTQLHPQEFDVMSHYKIQKSKSISINFDLILGYRCTIQLKTLLRRIPTIFFDKKYKLNLADFKARKPLTTSSLYTDFKQCLDNEYFKSRTLELLNYIDLHRVQPR